MSTNGYSIFNISYCFQRYPSCVDNIQSFMLRITFVEKGQNSNSQTYPFCYPYNRSPRTTEASCYKGYFTCTNNLNGGVVKLFQLRIYYIDFWCFNATFNKIQLYQFQWWRKPEYLDRTTDHGHATGKLYHLRLQVECTLFLICKTKMMLNNDTPARFVMTTDVEIINTHIIIFF